MVFIKLLALFVIVSILKYIVEKATVRKEGDTLKGERERAYCVTGIVIQKR